MTETVLDADAVIARLGLAPHPEGGWFRETWRDPGIGGGRGSGTAIFYLLPGGITSRWHRVDAVEIWHWYAGAPLLLTVVAGADVEEHRLGSAIDVGELPQAIVPEHGWQNARSLGAWTLVGCTVSPAFEFAGFELAPEGFDPRPG